MKMNIKRIAALLMTLVLLFCVSATAFATTVYSNIIIVTATEPPVEEDVTEPEVPAEEEVTEPEAPAEEEVTEPEVPAEEEVTEPEAPAEEEVTEPEAPAEEEVTEPEVPAEDVVTEPEAPAEEEVTEPEKPELPADLQLVENEEPQIDYATLLEGVTVTVELEVLSESPKMGDPVQLTAVVTGADEIQYNIVWETRMNSEEEWVQVPELTGEVVTFPLSVDNFMSEWRARLVLVIPEAN